MLEVLQSAVQGHYLRDIPFTGENLELDDLAMSINMLLEELRFQSKGKLHKKKSFYVSVLEQITIGIAVFDKNFKYIYCNPAYFSDEDLRLRAVGQTDFDLFRTSKINRVQAYSRFSQLREVRDKKTTIAREEYVEKEKKYYMMVVSPLAYKGSMYPELFICYRTDITSVREREEKLNVKSQELKRANDEFENFLRHVTHDLRAPLASIQGLIDISKHEEDFSQLMRNLDLMKTNVSKMDSFIKTILDYSKNTDTEPTFVKIDFYKEIESVIQLLKFMERADSINFNVDVDCHYDFHSDPTRLHMILNNLISNAIKYHNYEQHDPFIHIIVKAGEKSANITVIDNGEGINEEKHSKIFQSFERASEKSKGSGLGLYLVKEVVEKLNGKISFESIPGKGSRFEVTIPNAKTLLKSKLSQ